MRRFLRRYIPDPEHLRRNRWFRMLGSAIFQPSLWHLNRRTAPGAVAIGLFCGLIPGPLQMLGSVALCLTFRVNLPLALAATFYTNPVTIVPLYLVAFHIGSWLAGSGGSFLLPPEVSLSSPLQSLSAWGEWLITLGKPLAIGLPILACSLAALGYLLLSLLWRWHLVREWRRRKSKRACP